MTELGLRLKKVHADNQYGTETGSMNMTGTGTGIGTWGRTVTENVTGLGPGLRLN